MKVGKRAFSTATAAVRQHQNSLMGLSQAPQLGTFTLPAIKNEPVHEYAPGSADRKGLQSALAELRAQIATDGPIPIPSIVSGTSIHSSQTLSQNLPFEHQTNLATSHLATPATIQLAIKKALEVKPYWESLPFSDRAAIFLKAADLLSTKYRHKVMAATMLGQAKNAYQAEIDAAAELADFWRFNCQYAAQIYADQPVMNSPHTWNRMEYRGLEGFVVAYSPFNFTAIGGNLVSAPALMGNVVLWKPSPMAMYSNYLVYEVLKEAGLPDGVIQFLPADAELMTKETFSHPAFTGLHFTGSTHIFRHLYQTISNNLLTYKSYPRIVGETGGKNMHFIHPSADVQNAAYQTVRGAFEYNGQKCSATSRCYVPESLWPTFRDTMVSETQRLKMGPVDDFQNFITAVINEQSYKRITSYLERIQSGEIRDCEVLAGGKYSDEKGWYIEPTIVQTKDMYTPTMKDELFGPVLTCYVYKDAEWETVLKQADETTPYALTAAIFATSRPAIHQISHRLLHTAGNLYINDKSTGAVVGQQPFGGARASGTNDKAGSMLNLLRWTSPRTVKETFVPLSGVGYVSNQADFVDA
ncbi:Aldehyde/histidinol dehydrogenase [Gaertneriomyces semiglobifer]|nr:Aldehyde/histidinol dehydrogenase [Gaertneriomyces semiglobifer]KAI9001628.1 Aldehyde/histidinol dehydrogenase [Gaertneriomyces semiglobifer]